MSNKKRFTENEIKIIQEFYPQYGSQYCSDIIKRSKYCIRQKAAQLGVKLTKEQKRQIQVKAREKYPSEYDVNPQQFINIDTPEVAYILGLIWADGYVSHNNRRYVTSLTMKCSDYNGIEKLFLKTGKWKKYKRVHQKWKPVFEIKAYNKPLTIFLVENDYRIKSGASADKILSKIPDHLKHYWWRGYFDGDGCIPNPNSCSGCQIYISSVYSQNWEFLEKLCKEQSILSYKINRRNGKTKCSAFVITGYADSFKFLSYIYLGYYQDNIGLKRKYIRFQQMKEKSASLLIRKNCNLEKYKCLIPTTLNTENINNIIIKIIKENSGKVGKMNIQSLFGNKCKSARLSRIIGRLCDKNIIKRQGNTVKCIYFIN